MHTNTISDKHARKFHMDFLRIIAIFMVLFNHTGARGFMLFTVSRDSFSYWLYLFVAIFIKIAVPVFFMISGALLLPKEESVLEVLKNRVLRFVILLLVCSFISYLYSLSFQLSEFSIRYFIKTLYSSKLATAYWYLYAYLAYLLMLPLLQKFAKALATGTFCT